MGDTSGAALMKDKTFLNLLDKLDADAEEAEKQWKTQSSNSGLGVFPPDLVSQYKSDGAAMVKAQGNFNAEWNKVALGKGDVKKLMSTYDIYSLAFGALVESNTQIEALLEVDAAGKAAA
jgi:hypothetical protein